MTMRENATKIALLSSALLLSGCRVGPKYVRPTAPVATVPAYKESVPSAYANTEKLPGVWQPAAPSDAMLKGKWWEIFHEPELNGLEEQVNINNQNIATYFQNFMAARAEVREARAGLSPTLTTEPSWQRTKTPSALKGYGVSSTSGAGTSSSTSSSTTTTTNGTTSTDIALPFDVSWEPDLWGKVRNQIREYQYAAQVSAADLENERLTEQADLAEYYFELRAEDSLADLYRKTIDADQKTVELTRVLVETGVDSQQTLEQEIETLRNEQETAASVKQSRAIYEHAIAMLIGKPASDFSLPVKPLTTQPPAIPIGLPSQLLQRRPDIAAAERTMAEANALIGVEQAAYYPTLSLTGSGGLESSAIGSLFSAPALFWSTGASATETIFDAGLRRATVAQYRAQYDADVATYRQTVLTAFQQVEDYLATLRVTSEQVARQQQAIEAAQRALDIEKARYETGIDAYTTVLSDQSTVFTDQQTQLNARMNAMMAAVELIQALGGGWDVTQLPAAATINKPAAEQQARGTP